MLTLKQMCRYSVVALALALALVPSFVLAGPGGTGGGDHNSQIWAKVGHELLDQLAQKKSAVQVDVDALRQALGSTQVEFTTEELCLGKVKKDALNYPSEKRIRVNQAGWEKIAPHSRAPFVLHEYLGILGVDDTNYVISYKLLDLKPQKLICLIQFNGRPYTGDNGPLSAEFDKNWDGGISRRKGAVTVEHEGLGGNHDALQVTWDLTSIPDPTYTYNGSRDTRMMIRSPKIPGQLWLDLSFGTANQRYDSLDRTSVVAIFTIFDKNFLGKERRYGEGTIEIPFPVPRFQFAVRSPGWKQDAELSCTAE